MVDVVGMLKKHCSRGGFLVATLSVQHSPASAAIARRCVVTAFEEAGLGADQASDAALIASELVGNAVRHGRALPSGDILIEWTLSAQGYYIAVTDGGNPPSVTLKAADLRDTSGRGLMIVAALSQDWGVINGNNTTTVWTRVPLSPLATPAQVLESASRS
jgi:anti-sigma regulatory factor (Ser/Thr protein kinase)